MDIISRNEAKLLGLKHYFTGKPCSRGHIEKRWVSSRMCGTCTLLLQKAWYKINLEKGRISRKGWEKRNPESKRNRNAKRRAIKLDARPIWADEKLIQEFHKQAIELESQTGEKHHVDHVIPLNNKFVCGYDYELNLQILTEQENLVKGSKFTPYQQSADGTVTELEFMEGDIN